MAKEAAVELNIDGRLVRLTNEDKVLYPATGFTKGEVVGYYRAIAPVMIEHLRDHPLTLKRYPNGVNEDFFYEKQSPKHRPDWIEVVEIPASKRVVQYTTVDDEAGLAWLGNLAALEIHPLLARSDDLEHPVRLTFDLDPGDGASIKQCAEVALILRDVLAQLGVELWAKTSGSKGMQVDAGLDGSASFDESKQFAHALAKVLEKMYPEQIVSRMEKKLRRNKVFIDWSQNHITKTTVSVYSLRAVEEPRISTPVTWDEVQACAEGSNELRFLPNDVLDRVAKHGDLHQKVLTQRQKLPSAESLSGAV